MSNQSVSFGTMLGLLLVTGNANAQAGRTHVPAPQTRSVDSPGERINEPDLAGAIELWKQKKEMGFIDLETAGIDHLVNLLFKEIMELHDKIHQLELRLEPPPDPCDRRQ